jgi:hypothetical protein
VQSSLIDLRVAMFVLADSFLQFAGAPTSQHVLGSSFRSSLQAAQLLAVIPLLRCAYILLGDALSGAAFRQARFKASQKVTVSRPWQMTPFAQRHANSIVQ